MALYLLDCVRRVRTPTIVLRAWPLGIAAHRDWGALGAFGARFTLPPPLAGLVVEFPLHEKPGAGAADDRGRLTAALKGLRLPRVTSTAVYVVLFVAIPAVASWGSFGLALAVGLPLAYLLNLVQAAIVWRRRAQFPDATHLISDMLLCPPYGANLAGRLAARWQLEGRARDLAAAVDPAGAGDCFDRDDGDSGDVD